MDFEWDDEKQLSNVRKHGIDFLDAKEIWRGQVLEMPSAQKHHAEDRFVAIGQAAGRFLTVVFTWRGNNRRIISARIARKDERENYQKKIG